MIIAIDGTAASGKGTLARRLAEHYGLHYLDTGALYRAVARDCLARNFKLHDTWTVVALARNLDPASLGDEGLRSPGVGEAASIVAGVPEVRSALLDYQRAFARRQPGAVLDGRDIGTVVCPHADVKIFVDAAPEVRAKRRFLEREAKGDDATYEEVLELIKQRDERDSERGTAPMRIAAVADLLDTTDLDIQGAFETAAGMIKRKIGQ